MRLSVGSRRSLGAAKALSVIHGVARCPRLDLGPAHLDAPLVLHRAAAVAQLDHVPARPRQPQGLAAAADLVRARLDNRVDTWKKRRTALAAEQKRLVYERTTQGAGEAPLMIGAEASTTRDHLAGAPFVVANSMREVQPEINILVSPDPKRLFLTEPAGAPRWQPPTPKAD